MPERSPRVVRVAAVVLMAVCAVAFVAANRHDVPAAARAARGADARWLLVGALASASFVVAYGLARRSALAAFGVDLAPGRAVLTGAVAHSVNIVAKSGGMAGAAMFREEARRAGRPTSVVMGGYVLAVVLGDASFAITLLASLAILVADGRFTRGDLVASCIVFVYFAVVSTAVVAAVRSRSAIRRLYALPARVRRRAPDHHAADELYDACQQIRRRPRAVLPAFGWMVLIEVLGIVMVWACLRAYGQDAGLTVAVVGYGISVLFSVVGVLPAGIGFAEASLGAVLVGFGVPGPSAVVVVLTYRVLETWVPFAVGLILARTWRRRLRGAVT